MMLVRLLIRRFVIVVSIIGFIIQVLQVSMRYFAFTTTTHVALSMPDFIDQHPVAFCIRFYDILDRKELERKGVKLAVMKTLQDGIRNEGKLTIAQIFDHTPHPDHIIASCTYRPSSWLLRTAGAEECNKEFMVKKFFTQEFMCYDIRERVHRPTHMETVTRSTFSKGNIYTIFFNESLGNTDTISPIVFRGRSPGRSRDHAPFLGYLRDRPEKGNKQKFPFLYLTPADVNIWRLEKPYDTGCVPVMAEAGDDCRLECLLKHFKPFNRVPGYELLYQMYKIRPLSTRDAQHPTSGRIIRDIHEECEQKCMYKACNAGFTVTTSRHRLAENDAIGFSLTSPVYSRIDLTSQPTMHFVEFFSFLCSCFGTWFGVSFLSITSIRFLKRTKRTLRRPIYYR